MTDDGHANLSRCASVIRRSPSVLHPIIIPAQVADT
jgi:hypothetical protein